MESAGAKPITTHDQAVAAFASAWAACDYVLNAIGLDSAISTRLSGEVGSATVTGGTRDSLSVNYHPGSAMYGFSYDTVTSFSVAFEEFGSSSGSTLTGLATCWHKAGNNCDPNCELGGGRYAADGMDGANLTLDLLYHEFLFHDSIHDIIAVSAGRYINSWVQSSHGTLRTSAGASFDSIW